MARPPSGCHSVGLETLSFPLPMPVARAIGAPTPLEAPCTALFPCCCQASARALRSRCCAAGHLSHRKPRLLRGLRLARQVGGEQHAGLARAAGPAARQRHQAPVPTMSSKGCEVQDAQLRALRGASQHGRRPRLPLAQLGPLPAVRLGALRQGRGHHLDARRRRCRGRSPSDSQ